MRYVKTKNIKGYTYLPYKNNDDKLLIIISFLQDIKYDSNRLKNDIAQVNGNFQMGFDQTWLSISNNIASIKNNFMPGDTEPSPIVTIPLDVFYKLIDEWAQLYQAQVSEITLIQDDNGEYRFEWE